MLDVLADHATALITTFALIATAAILTARWESFSLWLLSSWHALPMVGGIAWIARRQAPRGGGAHMHSDRSAQRALCSSYARYVRVVNRADYDNYMNYLRKAGDLGRRPFPSLLWFVVFSMVVVEAAGFGYVLAGWTLPGASEVLQQIAAGGIGFLIAVILVFFTHWAGVEIYQSNQHQRDRREWLAAGKPGPLYGPDLSLNDAQSVDDAEPAYRQRATRGHGKTTYLLTSVTLVMVLAIGGGAAYVRGQVLEQELVLEAATRSKALDRFDLSLPDAALRERIVIDRQALADEIAIKRRGGWGTLVVLVIIFFFLQLLGMFFGYRYSFNGRLSRDAYRALNADRFSSFSELLQYYDRIADVAQSRLDLLQQAIARRRSGALGMPAQSYSFRDYLQEREVQRRDKPLGGEPGPGAGRAAATEEATPHLAAQSETAAANAEAPSVPPEPPAAPAIPKFLTAPTLQPPPFESPASPVGAQATPAGEPTAAADAHRHARPPSPGSTEVDEPAKVLQAAEALERQRAAERAVRAARAQARPRAGQK